MSSDDFPIFRIDRQEKQDDGLEGSVRTWIKGSVLTIYPRRYVEIMETVMAFGTLRAGFWVSSAMLIGS